MPYIPVLKGYWNCFILYLFKMLTDTDLYLKPSKDKDQKMYTIYKYKQLMTFVSYQFKLHY